MADSGGICVSARVQEDVVGKLDVPFEDLGEKQLKNIARPVQVYRVKASGVARPVEASGVPALPDKPSLAVLPFTNTSGKPEQEVFRRRHH